MKQAERNAQTQQLIKEAFIHLINEKGFNSLTVSDITREAGVSRGTFYVHYTDKFELIKSVIQCALYYHQMGIPNSSTASKNWLITYLLAS